MPPQKRVKSVVTWASKRWTQEKSTSVHPKKPAGDKGMQGRLELQINGPADRPQGQPSPVQLMLNQTVTTAPMQPSTLQPNGACRGQRPGHHYQGQSALLQLHGNNQCLNNTLVGNNCLISYHLGQHHGTPILGLTTSSTNQHPLQCTTLYHGWWLDWWQSALPYQQQQVFPPTTLQPQTATQTSTSVSNQQQVNQPVPLQQSTSNPTQPASNAVQQQEQPAKQECHQSHLGFYHSCNITTCLVSG